MNHDQTTLLDCIRNLPDEQRSRLRTHARKKTPIACGPRWPYFYVDGAG